MQYDVTAKKDVAHYHMQLKQSKIEYSGEKGE